MRLWTTLGCVLLSGTALLGCIQSEGDPELGEAQYWAGVPTASGDFLPVTQPSGGAGVATAPLPTAGTSAPSFGGAGGTGGFGGTGGSIDTGGIGGTGGLAGTGGVGGIAGSGPAAGTGGTAGSGPTAGTGGTDTTPVAPPAAAGTLTFTFTTVDLRGQYAPRNIGAVWVENGSGQFVKTIERWAGIRASHLTKWAAASGGWSTSGGFFGIGGTPSADQMDAISRATLPRHETHMLSWDMQDATGAVVPDGTYTIKVEMTDNEISSALGEVRFEKGPAPQSVTPANQPSFSGATLTYTP